MSTSGTTLNEEIVRASAASGVARKPQLRKLTNTRRVIIGLPQGWRYDSDLCRARRNGGSAITGYTVTTRMAIAGTLQHPAQSIGRGCTPVNRAN